jgi:hypothetical protein
MSLRLVISGSFRSGTTYLWEQFRRNNPDCVSLYEPCHEELPWKIDQFETEFGGRQNVEKNLWQEYVDHAFQPLIRRAHPHIGEVFPKNFHSIEPYIRSLAHHGEARDLIIKTNRWLMHLGEIHRAFDAKLCHIVRNPFSVLDSMVRNDPPRGLLDLIADQFGWRHNVFYLKETEAWFRLRHYGLNWNRTLVERLSTALNRDAVFLFCWTKMNLSALRDVKASNGIILCYESLASHRDLLEAHSKERLGLNLGDMADLNSPVRPFFSESELSRARALASKTSSLEDFEELLELVQQQ